MIMYQTIETNVLVVGCGAAGYNALDELYLRGVKDILGVCENTLLGISRNTGSDKQTFYKLSTTGKEPDSVFDMAQSLKNGKSMDGDIALTLSANSLYSFYKLVNYGVPFPSNEYGEYVGYKTDHDERKRATSCGPLTSKYMVEHLEKKVKANGTKIMENVKVTSLIKDGDRVIGCVAFSPDYITKDNPYGMFYIKANNIIWATGGPSSIYSASVYPAGVGCSFGYPIMSGCKCANLTESQYGIASVKFKWNLSGSYQQVIPKYISVDENGCEREFLLDYLSENEACNCTFRKGYEWPFNPDKIKSSSIIDIAVLNETEKGRKVYLDFTCNPSGFAISKLCEEAYIYLYNSDSFKDTPIERLKTINPKAYDLFKSHNIDLEKDRLEIAVCAQHLNGGFEVDINGQSTSLNHIFFAGECAGTYGVKRPGGSALLATQVFSMRAAKYISKNQDDIYEGDFLTHANEASSVFTCIESGYTSQEYLRKTINNIQRYFSSWCGPIRNGEKIKEHLTYLEHYKNEFYEKFKPGNRNTFFLTINLMDILVTQIAIGKSILAYIEDGGTSRGSYLIYDGSYEDLLTNLSSVKPDTSHSNLIENTVFDGENIICSFRPAKEIPKSEQWFETVYNNQ